MGSGGPLHTFECQMSQQHHVQMPNLSGSPPEHGSINIMFTSLDVGMDSWDKGILTNLAMQEIKLNQLRTGDPDLMPLPSQIAETVEFVLKRFKMGYTNALIAEIAQRLHEEMTCGL